MLDVLFLVADRGGDSLVGLQRLLVAVASPVAELRLWDTEAAVAVVCSSLAVVHGILAFRSGTESVSPLLEGGFLSIREV